MAKFSIIIPVYNVEKYLDACVESVLSQSFTDFEVLLIDDGATDSSGAMCDAWAAKDGRIRVIHQENQGLSGARNTGIRAASGDYLMFLDSDDWWAGADVLRKITARLEETNAEVISLNYRKVWSNESKQTYFSSKLNDLIPPICDLSLMTANHLWIACAWNKVVDRHLFQQHDLLFIPGIVSEDIDWCVRLALCAERFSYLGEPFICYRQRAGSLCHTVSASRVEGLYKNIEECLRLLHMAPSNKAKPLKSYIAYQYATMVYNLAEVSSVTDQSDLMSNVRSKLHLLNWSDNAKVKLLKAANQVLGFKGMLLVLRIRQRLLRG